MKLHTDTLGAMHVINAAHKAGQSLGCLLSIDVAKVGSRSHAHAFEVHMTGDGTTCRNRTNGSHGSGERPDFSAGYAGWGWLMAELYDLDTAAVWGTVKNPVYASEQDFHAKTASLFDTDLHLAARKAQTLCLQKNGSQKVWAILRARKEVTRGTPGAVAVLATFGTDAS